MDWSCPVGREMVCHVVVWRQRIAGRLAGRLGQHGKGATRMGDAGLGRRAQCTTVWAGGGNGTGRGEACRPKNGSPLELVSRETSCRLPVIPETPQVRCWAMRPCLMSPGATPDGPPALGRARVIASNSRFSAGDFEVVE